MKRKLKNNALNSDIVYDGDSTSSSDSENLQTFHQTYMSNETSISRKYSSSDADDEVNEDTSDEDINASNQTSSTSSDDETELQTETSTRTLHASSKIEKLRSQLTSLSKVSSNIEVTKSKSHNAVKNDMLSACIEEDDINSKKVSEKVDSTKDSTSEMPYHKDSQPLPELSADKERLEIRDELTKMSMEEILQLKEKLGSKLYNRTVGMDLSSALEKKSVKNKKDEMKRENKNRPREMSSKKTVKRLRDVVGLSTDIKAEKRDPRFDNMCGEFDEKIHRDAYKFVDDIKSKELRVLKDELVNENSPEKVKQLKYLIQRMENQNREKKKVEKEKNSLRERKKSNRQLVKDGQTPEFVSKAEEKSRNLIEKYEELKQSNKLEQYMKKKNKKNLSKDRKKMKTFETA